MQLLDLIRKAQYLKKHGSNPNFKFYKNFKTKYQNSGLFKKIIKLNIKNDQNFILLFLISRFRCFNSPNNKKDFNLRRHYLLKKYFNFGQFVLFSGCLKYLLVKLIVNLFNLEVKNLNIDNRFVNLKTLYLFPIL